MELLLAFRAETSINIKMKTVTGCRQERANNERVFFCRVDGEVCVYWKISVSSHHTSLLEML